MSKFLKLEMSRTIKKMLLFLTLGGSLSFLVGCQSIQVPKERNGNLEEKTKRIEKRLERLEQKYKSFKIDQKRVNQSNDIKAPSGPIESLTLRTGTNDDRLRIYWSEGTKTDLPCTKEQSDLWVCG